VSRGEVFAQVLSEAAVLGAAGRSSASLGYLLGKFLLEMVTARSGPVLRPLRPRVSVTAAMLVKAVGWDPRAVAASLDRVRGDHHNAPGRDAAFRIETGVRKILRDFGGGAGLILLGAGCSSTLRSIPCPSGTVLDRRGVRAPCAGRDHATGPGVQPVLAAAFGTQERWRHGASPRRSAARGGGRRPRGRRFHHGRIGS